MYLEKDWLHRILRQLSEAMVRVAGLRAAEQYDAALGELQHLYEETLALPAMSWVLFQPSLIDDMGSDFDRMAVLCRIFEERAEIEWQRNNVAEAARIQRFAEHCRAKLTERGGLNVLTELQ